MSTADILTGIFSAFLLVVVGSLMICVTRNHRSTLRFQWALLLVAFAVRFTMSLLLYVFGLNEKIVGSGDDSGWGGGVYIKEFWEAEGVGPLDWPVALLAAYDGTNRGYKYLLAVYFSVTHVPSQLSAAALSSFCGALGVVLVYRTARLLFSEGVAARTGWWTCFFPLMIIWSAQTIKEPVVILLEMAALYGCVSIRMRGLTARHSLLSAVSVVVLPTMRFYAAYVAGTVILLSLAWPRIQKKKTSSVVALLVAVLALPLLATTSTFNRHTDEFEKWGNLDRSAQFRRDIAQGSGSGVASEHDMHTSSGLGLATVDGFLHLLLAPFPWEIRGSLRMWLTAPEMVVWWLLFWRGVLPGLIHAVRHRLGDVLPLLLFIAGLGLIYSLTFGNVGLVYRQRAQLLPYLLIFAASGLEQRKLRRSRTQPRDVVGPAGPPGSSPPPPRPTAGAGPIVASV